MDIKDQIQFILSDDGVKKYVVLPIDLFEEMSEDYFDLKAIEERKNEPCVGLNELKAELKRDGKL
ncbi:MAG: hypothetical protein HYZ79_08595 [Candidatus Melainabacteria bacterium]|nr:hypothetical protein [Candidatus Melainabacteria bacterium]